MAFPYYPATYQSYYQPVQQPAYQQTAQQPMQQTQQMMPPPQVSNVWVYNRSEVDVYPVAPNNAVRLWDTNEPVFYLKQADASGRPSVKVFDYHERSEEAPAPVAGSPAYVTKEELSAALEALKADIGKAAEK